MATGSTRVVFLIRFIIPHIALTRQKFLNFYLNKIIHVCHVRTMVLEGSGRDEATTRRWCTPH